MSPLTYLLLGFAPGLFWLWQILRSGQHRPEPRSLVLRTFLLGVLIAAPIVLVETLVEGGRDAAGGSGRMHPADAFFVAFVVAGLVEETGKFLVVRTTLFRSPYLDNPLRGLVYSAAVALGFASIENVVYMLRIDPAVIVPRSVLCTLGHVAFSGVWGYALGAARSRGDDHPSAGLVGLSIGVGLHGLYDYFLFVGDSLSGLAVFLLSALIFLFLLLRARHQSRSSQPEARATAACPRCQKDNLLPARFCTSCGASFAELQLQHRCGQCQQVLSDGARFCNGCGSRVQRAAVG